MVKSKAEADLENRAEFFKALGHPVRLLMVNLIAMKARHGEELAAILKITPATASHHLAMLIKAGLVTTQKDQYYQMYSLSKDPLAMSLEDLIRLPVAGLEPAVEEDAFRKSVLDAFFQHGRLLKLPVQLKKQLIVLEKIAQHFEPGRAYSERALNHELLDFHDDIALLRRSLVDHGFFERSEGVYRRIG